MKVPPILESKKFLASVLASLISFLGVREGFSPEQILLVIGPLMGFVGMQGVADIGKEKAKVEAKKTIVASAGSHFVSETKPATT